MQIILEIKASQQLKVNNPQCLYEFNNIYE